VHKLIDKPTWTARYDRIRDFEKELAENGTVILKFFLLISKEEQLARFAERLNDPARNWKISESDYSERALWDDYIEAFQGAERHGTHHAPWFVIQQTINGSAIWRFPPSPRRWTLFTCPTETHGRSGGYTGGNITPRKRRRRRKN
jgi:hypothetical protein